nr:EamA family transporter [uncultured Sphaerochaeta sp.]
MAIMIKRMNGTSAFVLSMVIFGTIGAFVRVIGLSSPLIAFYRGLLGTLYFLPSMRSWITNQPDLLSLWLYRRKLLLSAFLLAGNWILLFEAFRNTTIAIASLLYYTAPLLVLLFSRIGSKERIPMRTLISLVSSFFGMVLLCNVEGNDGYSGKGVLFGMGAALCYAGLIMVNRSLKELPEEHTTPIQLALSTLVLAPYLFLFELESFFPTRVVGWAALAILGFVHSGFGFLLFFQGVKTVEPKKIAILGYLDPLVSVLISVFLFQEILTQWQIVGSLILIVSIVFGRKK